MKPFFVMIPVLLAFQLSTGVSAEEITVVRGGEEALQEAIQNRTRSGPSAGFAAPLPVKNPKKTTLPAPEPRPVPVSQGVLVPYQTAGLEQGSAAVPEAQVSEYDKNLELSPPRRFSRNLDRHDSFEDELAQSTLSELRNGYTVNEGEQSSRETRLI